MFQKKKKRKKEKNKNDTVLNFHVLPFIDNKTFDANIGLPVTYCVRLIIFATKCLTCFGRGPSIVSIKVGVKSSSLVNLQACHIKHLTELIMTWLSDTFKWISG